MKAHLSSLGSHGQPLGDATKSPRRKAKGLPSEVQGKNKQDANDYLDKKRCTL